MKRYSRRQRAALVALLVTNVVVLGGVALIFLRSTTDSGSGPESPGPSLGYLETCRDAVSDALLQVGHTGLVHTQPTGTILIQLQPTPVAENSRLDADAAIWAAFQAIADSGTCVGLSSAHIAVLLSPGQGDSGSFTSPCSNPRSGETADTDDCERWEAVARASVADIMLWSLGDLDDAQLALRVEYLPTATPASAPR